MEPVKELNKAKLSLMGAKQTTFLTNILFNLKQSFTDRVPTAGTNGKEIFINGEWFASLTPDERVGLLAHEIMHVALNHMARGKKLQKTRYNIAADHVGNLLITSAGMVIPQGGYCDPQYRGMSTKEVYDLLPENEEHDESGAGLDIIYDDPNMSPEETYAKEVELTNIIHKAMIASDLAGDNPGLVPGDIRRMIDKIINPKLPWDVVLQNYMTEYIKEDYSNRRPNRRFFPDFYLPSQEGERIANISAAIDLSGSITDKMLTAFLSELKYIWEVMKPMEMEILGWDTKISDFHNIKEGDNILNLEFQGGGGTKVSPVLSYFNKTQPTVAIIFTDMQFEHYTIDPTFPIIWVCIDNENEIPRHGTLIHYTT